MSQNQIRKRMGIVYKLGLNLKIHFPNLAMGYRGNLKQIAINIQEKKGDKIAINNNNGKITRYKDLPLSILQNGVRHCLSGFEENEFHEGYIGLMSPLDYKNAKGNGGKITRDLGKGLFKLTKKQKQEIGKRNVIKLHTSNGDTP